jgi:hypothetical protein
MLSLGAKSVDNHVRLGAMITHKASDGGRNLIWVLLT